MGPARSVPDWGSPRVGPDTLYENTVESGGAVQFSVVDGSGATAPATSLVLPWDLPVSAPHSFDIVEAQTSRLRGLRARSQSERGRRRPLQMPSEASHLHAPALEGLAVAAFAGPDDADTDAFVGGDSHTRTGDDRVGPVDVSLDAVDRQLHLVGGDRFTVGPGDLDVGVVDPLDRPVTAGCGVVLGRVEVEREHAHRDH